MAKQSIAKDVMFFWTPLRILAFSSAVASPIPSMRNMFSRFYFSGCTLTTSKINCQIVNLFARKFIPKVLLLAFIWSIIHEDACESIQ